MSAAVSETTLPSIDRWNLPVGLATPLRFTVYARPVSTNHMYYRRRLGRGKGLGRTEEATDFKNAAAASARIAHFGLRWPKANNVAQVALAIVVMNCGHDCSGSEKLVADALEGVVYDDDRVAHPRLNDFDYDDGPVRVEVEVRLLRIGPPPRIRRAPRRKNGSTRRLGSLPAHIRKLIKC